MLREGGKGRHLLEIPKFLKKTLAFWGKSDYIWRVLLDTYSGPLTMNLESLHPLVEETGAQTMTALPFAYAQGIPFVSFEGYWWYWRKDIGGDVCPSAGLV